MASYLVKWGRHIYRKILHHYYKHCRISPAAPSRKVRTIYVKPTQPNGSTEKTRDQLRLHSYCSICFEEFSELERGKIVKCRRQNCGACYHSKCIQRWLSVRRDVTPTCVMCTLPIRPHKNKKRRPPSSYNHHQPVQFRSRYHNNISRPPIRERVF